MEVNLCHNTKYKNKDMEMITMVDGKREKKVIVVLVLLVLFMLIGTSYAL